MELHCSVMEEEAEMPVFLREEEIKFLSLLFFLFQLFINITLTSFYIIFEDDIVNNFM